VGANAVSGNLDGVLVLRGSGLARFCNDTSRLEAWTAAPLLAAPTCNESAVVAVYNASADTGVWLWYGSAAVVGLPAFGPDRSHPSIITAAPALAWGATLNVTALGIGTAGVTGVTVGPSRLPCTEVAAVGRNTVTCRLRFLSSALLAPGAAVTVWVAFSVVGATVAAGVIASPPVAPVLTAWQLPTFLPRGGGTVVTFTLPQPAWTDAEVATLPPGVAGSDIRLMLLNPSGGGAYTSAPCAVVGGTQVVCASPPGHGLGVHIVLVLNGMLNVSVPTSGAGGQLVATAAYLPPAFVTVAPSYVALPPPTTTTTYMHNLALTADTVADLGLLVNITLSDGPCAAVTTTPGSSVVTCVGWDGAAAARRAAAAAPDADTYPLTVAFWWGGAAFAGAPAPLGTLVLRPIVTGILPASVTPGGVLIVFGDYLCPTTGCDTTRPDSQVVVSVGSYSCTGASAVSRTVATCTVPSVSAADAKYPVYNVSVANGLGSVAGGQQPTVTYPSSGYVRTRAPPPLSFIPSDATVPWLVNGTVEVELMPVGTAVPYPGNIACSLTPITPGVLLLPRERASLLDVVDAGRVSFGAFAIQAPFSLTAVTLSAACTSTNSDYTSTTPISVQLLVTPLRVSFCTRPPAQSHSHVALPTWALALTLAGGTVPTWDMNSGWAGPPLPAITCTATVDATTSTVQPALVGFSTTLSASSGMAVFDGTSIGGSVDSDVTLAIACAVGSLAIPDTLRHTVRITGCAPGSAPQGSLCVPCTAGEYSDGGADACHSCPHTGAACSTGVLTLLPGFYRPPALDDQPLDGNAELHACALPDGCLVNNTRRSFSCAEGYTGVLCGVCDAATDYGRIGNACVGCLPTTASKAMLAVGVIVALLLVGVFALRSAGRTKSDSSIVLRILLTHVQSLGALLTFSASGTALYKQVMSWVDVLSPAVVSQGPAQCLMRPDFLSVFLATLTAPLVAAAAGLVILVVATPLFVGWGRAGAGKSTGAGGTSTVITAPASWLQRTRAELVVRWSERRPLAILIFVAHLAYMPITTAAINVFKCTQPVDGTRYLVADLRVSCSEPTYAVAAVIAGGVLALFSLGFPIMLYVIMSNTRPAALVDPYFERAWGYLYSGYRYTTDGGKEVTAGANDTGTPSTTSSLPLASAPMPVARRATSCLRRERDSLAHWESLVVLRKAGIVLSATVLSDPMTQVVILNLMMVAFLVAHTRVSPYAAPYFNLLDAASMATIIVIATLCVVTAEVAGNDTSSAYYGVTALMLIINLAALALFAATGICVTRTTAGKRKWRKPEGGDAAGAASAVTTATGTATIEMTGTGSDSSNLPSFTFSNPLAAGSAVKGASKAPVKTFVPVPSGGVVVRNGLAAAAATPTP